MNALSEPVVPLELLPYWDEHAQEAHERLAHLSLRQVMDEMPTPAINTVNGALHVDLKPNEDHDRKTAVVLTLPYTNGWKPHMAIRAQMLQDMLPEPTRLIVFPDNRQARPAYALTNQEQNEVASGRFDPIADKQAFTIGKLEIEKVHIIGYSFGASVGASALRLALENGRFEIGNSGLFEPPNNQTRKVRELEIAFFQTKLKDLNRSINESAIPALTEAQHSSGWLNNISQRARITLDWGISWLDSTMRAVKQGMATSSFTNDVSAIAKAEKDFWLTLGGGADSAVFPIGIQDYFRYVFAGQKKFQVSAVSIEGQKHTMADNVVLHALLARRAIEGQLAA